VTQREGEDDSAKRERNTNVMTAVRDANAEAKVTGREVESKPYVARPYVA